MPILEDARNKTDCITFAGPEPTMNPSLASMIRLAKVFSFKDIRLVTNGRLLCYIDYARDLLETGVTNVVISLHGSNKSIHDTLTRTPGSFSQTIRGCRNLSVLKAKYHFRWEINPTLNKINAPDLFDFFKLAFSFRGVDAVGVNALIPAGRALRHFDKLVKDYSNLSNAYRLAVERFCSGDQNIRDKISILGLPVCLFKGYLLKVGYFEPEIRLDNDKAANEQKNIPERIKNRACRKCLHYFSCHGIPERIKNRACRKCLHYFSCHGVWKEYIKRRGWREFCAFC